MKFFAEVGPGDIVGEKMFFSNTVCTSSFIALTAMRIQYIDQESIKSWAGTCPALEDKLHDYCNSRKVPKRSMDQPIAGYTRGQDFGGLKFQMLNEKGAPSATSFRANSPTSPSAVFPSM